MNFENIRKKTEGFFRKLGAIKYAILILIIGIVLISIPERKKDNTLEQLPVSENEYVDITERLEQVIETIHGAGKTKVMLTLASGSSNSYQTNSEVYFTEEGERRKVDTVLASSGSGTEEALVVSVTYPSYRGAVVVCEGAESPSVRLNVVQVVSSLTGLTSDKIAVIKMSSN